MQPFDFDSIGELPGWNSAEDAWLQTNGALRQDESGQYRLDDLQEYLTPTQGYVNTTLPPPPEEMVDPATMDLDKIWSPLKTPLEREALADVGDNARTALNDDTADHSNKSGAAKYQFRPQTRILKGAFNSTWLDEDTTGNYDPTEERREERLRRNRVKFRRRERVGGLAGSCLDDDDEADDEAIQKFIPTLNVTARFQSEIGKANFAQVISTVTAKSSLDDDLASGHCLRRRHLGVRRGGGRVHGDYDDDKPRVRIDLLDNLTGHPVARGCRACLGLGISCSLLDNEHSWPCVACLDDDQDCDLVTPPELRRACERCKRRRTACSYTHSLDQNGPCKQCGEDGYKCVAGPVKEAVRTRIRYERDWQIHPMPKKRIPKVRKILTCTDCRKAGRNCSFSTGDGSAACAACKEAGDEDSCVVDVILPQRHVPGKHRDRKQKSKADALPATPTSSFDVADDVGGTTRTIQTNFCHPIIFNYEDNTAGKEPCHFCVDAGYAAFGLEAREVEVIEWADGRGLEEVSGGHRGEGIENTRMCPDCTLGRLTIIMCPAPKFRPIAGVQRDALNMSAALFELLSGEGKVSRRWCSICPSSALHECCTASEVGKGCGLSLCEACMALLAKSFDGDLQKMLLEMKDEPTAERIMGLRADYELLKQDGLLMRYMLWSSQQ